VIVELGLHHLDASSYHKNADLSAIVTGRVSETLNFVYTAH